MAIIDNLKYVIKQHTHNNENAKLWTYKCGEQAQRVVNTPKYMLTKLQNQAHWEAPLVAVSKKINNTQTASTKTRNAKKWTHLP